MNIKIRKIPTSCKRQCSSLSILLITFLASSISVDMHNVLLLTVSGLVASSMASMYGTSSPNTTCNFFKQYYPNMTILPSDPEYTIENEGKSSTNLTRKYL